MNSVLEKIQEIGIVPVVVINDAKDAEKLAKALCDGGLPCAEVTFRTEAAQESIRIMTEKFPQMLVGAGTVLSIAQVDRAVEQALANCDKPITVAVMGCVVNGPGEAREADVGIAGGEDCGVLFVKGEMVKKLPYDGLLDALVAYVDTL